mgnify:CR=1 FL=1
MYKPPLEVDYKKCREFYIKDLSIKSPYFKDRYIPKDPYHWGSNVEWAREIEKETEKIDLRIFFEYEISIFYENLNNIYFYYFLSKTPYMDAYFFYKKQSYGFECFDTYTWCLTALYPRILIFEYFLPQLKTIFFYHSLKCRDTSIWKNILPNNINNPKYEFGVYYIYENKSIICKNLSDFNNFWNDPNIRIWIKLKEKII